MMPDTMLSLTGFQYCPKCGSKQIAAHAASAMDCNACGFRYFHNTACAAAGIVEMEGGILMIRRSVDPGRGKLDLPGGFVDYGETYENAVVREIREETGLDVTIERFFGSFANTYDYRGVTYHTTDAIFICSPIDGASHSAQDETMETVVAPADSIDESHIAFESIRNVLRVYRSGAAND